MSGSGECSGQWKSKGGSQWRWFTETSVTNARSTWIYVLYLQRFLLPLNQSSTSIKAEVCPESRPNSHLPFQARDRYESLQHLSLHGWQRGSLQNIQQRCGSHRRYTRSAQRQVPHRGTGSVSLSSSSEPQGKMWYENSPAVLQVRAQVYE